MGENPRLIDEWQIAPVLWDAVRTAVDNRRETGYLLFPHFTTNHFGEIPQIISPNTANYSNKMPQITATRQRKSVK